MSKVSVGSDPEFMLMLNGGLRSAIGVVPGTKYNPHKLKGNNYYYDNVMAECTVKPGQTRDAVIDGFRQSLATYAKLVHPHILHIQASADYPSNQLQAPQALEIGCDPETCCYEVRNIEPPTDDFIQGTLRSAGGHLHIGSDWITQGKPKSADHSLNCLATARMCDLFLGTMSIFLDVDPTSKQRKKLYGKAGRFRRPPHGTEYRSLGNFWIASPKLVGFVYDTTTFIMDFLESGGYNNLWDIDIAVLKNPQSWVTIQNYNPANYHKCIGYNVAALRTAIDNVDQRAGKKFLEFIRGMMPKALCDQFATLAQDAANGVHYDLYKEWGLNGNGKAKA